jgi:hypothetical protein
MPALDLGTIAARKVVIDEILEILRTVTDSPTLALGPDQAVELVLVLLGAGLELLRRAGVTKATLRRMLIESLKAYPCPCPDCAPERARWS